LGRMRLELVTKPVVIDKKTTYSRRIGAETVVDYVYSPDERSTQLCVYRWSDADADWLEVDGSNFSNL
jgi:hypothetical protein